MRSKTPEKTYLEKANFSCIYKKFVKTTLISKIMKLKIPPSKLDQTTISNN